MSETGKPTTSRADFALIGIAVVLILGIFWYVTSNSQQALRRSPLGLEGLQSWLAVDGHPTRVFSGGWTQDPGEIGLRIMPIHDTRPGQDRDFPATQEEYLFQSDEFDIRADLVRKKIAIVPTVLVLPKWRSGVRLTGVAHPILLIENGRAGKMLSSAVPGPRFETRYIMRPFSDFEVVGDTRSVRLYVAQVFSRRTCTPIIGTPDAMVMGRCPYAHAPGGSIIVVSDPDLLNNHGLRLGDNAHVVRDILLKEAGDKTVLIDYSTRVWLFDQASQTQRERTWSDLLQFFAYPFSLLWASAGLLMGLVLWRAGVRYGPILDPRSGFGASKVVANAARARLMRLTGQDGALLGDYADTRLAAIAARYLGPANARQPDAAQRLIRRKRPDLADKLDRALAAIHALPPKISPHAAIAHVDTFEQILEQFEHDT